VSVAEGTMREEGPTEKFAVLSDCGKYRYFLARLLSEPDEQHQRKVLFIMLNPSVADHLIDDPTIRRCMSFARREGAFYMGVVNLYALRATDPKILQNHVDPHGPENWRFVLGIIKQYDLVIAAWGANKAANCVLARRIKDSPGLKCLGKTKDGSPRHPLYVKADQPLESFT
jgi:hypothetical protein